MTPWDAIANEASDDRLPLVVGASVVLVLILRALAPSAQSRIRAAIAFLGLYLVLVPLSGALRFLGSPYARETRVAALFFAALSVIGLLGALVFKGILPRLRVQLPRILQDVTIAFAGFLALVSVAAHAGINLSGLIATSAVLTAVIGLAFQDTLGNIVGGLALQLDRSIGIGDWIKVGDVSGRVVEIRWRYTAIETRNWETVIVPNSLIVKGQVLVLGRRSGEGQLWRRWVYFNVDFRHSPTEVIECVQTALRNAVIENVASAPQPNCVLLDLGESTARYAARYWLTDLAHDDPTDSVVRTRVYFALRRKGMALSIPAHAVFLTEESSARAEEKSQKDMERRRSALEKVDLFGGLSDEEHEALAASLRHAPFARGEVLTRQGAEAHWLYLIIAGQVAVRIGAERAEREVARLEAGAFFGEMSLLTGEPRSATVVALTDVECYRLDRSEFQRLLERRPALAEHVADVLAKRRVELDSVKEHSEVSEDRLRNTRTDLVAQIRRFFGVGPSS